SQTAARDGGGGCSAYCVDSAPRGEFDRSRNGRALHRREVPVIETQMGEGHDLVFGQICRLLDARMACKIAGRTDHNMPDVATEADRDERRIRQMANAQS